jgi:AbrB family looped-hinge helix DNA binding protein
MAGLAEQPRIGHDLISKITGGTPTMSQALATTKMSSRGQVVIPEAIREELNIEPGAQFIVVGNGDVIMLKVVSPPAPDEYKELKRRLRRYAKEAGLKRSDIPKAMTKVRRRK